MTATGKTAYEAYVEASGGVSLVSGSKLPLWEEQAEGIKAAWEHVARTLRMRFEGALVEAVPVTRTPVIGDEAGRDQIEPIILPPNTPQPL